MTENTADRKKAVRRTAIILVGVALTFYLGFILMSVLRA
jgi:hypothetical protein